MSINFKKGLLRLIIFRPLCLLRDLCVVSQTHTYGYIRLWFSASYCLLSKAAILRFGMTSMSNSGQLASNQKQHPELANELQARKAIQAIACLIIAKLITFFSIASYFLLNKMTHMHMINKLPSFFFVWRPERRCCSSFSFFTIFRGSYESRDWGRKQIQ